MEGVTDGDAPLDCDGDPEGDCESDCDADSDTEADGEGVLDKHSDEEAENDATDGDGVFVDPAGSQNGPMLNVARCVPSME